MTAVVAIDGPSGAGKGTVARAVARSLRWRYVDTGAMYRAVAWKAQREGRPLDDEDAVATAAAGAVLTLDEDGRVAIDGHDVTEAIRTPAIDAAAAKVARMPRVRELLVARQRRYADRGPIVMEGRDIGTVVFPGAAAKIYLDASPEERAARRARDPAHHPLRAAEIGAVAHALEQRDRLDRTRRVSPLKRAPDAAVVDTTGVSIDTVVSRVLAIVRERLRSA